MAVRARLEDGSGTGTQAIVTTRGELVVGNVDYSSAYNALADVINTGYNLVPPKTHKEFVITGIALYADKDVGVNDATITVYESDGPTSTTELKVILNLELPEKTYRDLLGLRILVSEGVWVNVKTDDDDIYATVFGYYLEANGE